jgi:hypothetical protein
MRLSLNGRNWSGFGEKIVCCSNCAGIVQELKLSLVCSALVENGLILTIFFLGFENYL